MVDPAQYAQYSMCQALSSPSAGSPDSPCAAWWRTESAIFAAQKSGTQNADIFLSADALDTVGKGITLYGQQVQGQGGIDIRISLTVDPSSPGQASLWEEGDSEYYLGGDLQETGKVLGILSIGATIYENFSQEFSKNESGARPWLSAGVKTVFEVTGGAMGATAGGMIGGAGDPAGGELLAIPGSAIGSHIGEGAYGVFCQIFKFVDC
jgi:hypothetical protein